MIRETDLISYLPPYLKEFKEIVSTLSAENPEFLLIWNACDRVLYNHFIYTADAIGIEKYEKLLNIYPIADDTLENRRTRVAIQWAKLLPYTMKMFLQKLNMLCGEGSYIVSNNFSTGYTLNIVTYLENYGQTEELNRLLQEMIPCNININSTNSILCSASTTAKFGCRLVTHANIVLTHDFKATFAPINNSEVVGVVCPTNKIIITHDFNEVNDITGMANFASRAAGVDFIEIK